MKDKNFLQMKWPLSDGTSETSQALFRFIDYVGKKIVLYFYPKDSTPGCTTEGLEFTALAAQFAMENCMVVGVSKDSIKSHHKFICKYNFKFPLIADQDGSLCAAFGVMKEKNLYGHKFIGIERSTFLINENGDVVCEWRKVKAVGHAQVVLDRVRSL